jgi:Mor family transcriptional regulator
MAQRVALAVEQHEAVIAEYREGLSIAKLAKRFECSGRAVWRVLQLHGVKARRQVEYPRLLRVPAEQHQAIASDYGAGMGTPSLAKKWGYSERAIRSVLKAQGVMFRKGWAKEPGETRTCRICKETKPIGAFSPVKSLHGAKSRTYACRPCLNAYTRPFNRTARTGLTTEAFDGLLKQQRGKCALCLKAKRLVVDHDHKTRVIRGLLCGGCNRLMVAMDDPKWAGRAIAYRARNTGHQWPAAKKKTRTT